MTTVRIVESGGIPVVPVESGAPLLIASEETGFPITLVERFGAPFVVRGYNPPVDDWDFRNFSMTTGTDGTQWVGFSVGGDTLPNPPFGSIGRQPTLKTDLLAFYEDTNSGIVLAVFEGEWPQELATLQVSIGGFNVINFETEVISGNTWVRFNGFPGIWSPGELYEVEFSFSTAEWYDYPAYDDFQMGIRLSDQSGFRATGPKVNGRYPKEPATFDELFNFTGPAGRGYMPTGRIPYVYDTIEDQPRFDGERMAYEPLPRFNRVFPSGEFTMPITIYLINYPYLFSFYGTGSITVTGAEVPGGTWTLAGSGDDVRTWGIMPHPNAGDVTVTPTGDVRFINADTHGVSGYDPDYPTNTIQTESARVDQAAETLQFSTDLMELMSEHEGTIVVQGQFWAPATDTTGGRGRRIALGWDHNAYLGVDMDGNVVNNTGWGVALSTPLGTGGNGDTFRLAISWRGQSGGASDGIRRMAGNGGAAVEHAHPWSGGLGDHTLFTLGRASNEIFGQESGGGRYDYFLFNSELLSLEDVSSISELT